jgi:hypothetical protein
MSDTLLNNVDTITNKIESLAKQVESISDTTATSIWTPLVATLIGVFGTLVVQAIDRWYRYSSEKKKEIREIKSKCINIKIRLRGLFRQLATSECDSAQWYFIYKTDIKNYGYAYNEHLKCESESKSGLREIENTIADFLSEVIKYEKIANPLNVESLINEIEQLKFPNKSYYDQSIDPSKLVNEIAPFEKQKLKDRYFENIIPFENIINRMD